ncbi:MMPL family protein [Botrimarina colliarenosi]|uniref:MMPL family protein n=2 Tax=Botrimarina colliarenosi TaxID=2528001 RepID=A0A5C6A634_9BACT|nr:MMPL family protein [Botrimarina colliarenosi]
MLAYAVIATPSLVLGAMRALEANNNSPIDWVDSDFAPRAEYDRLCEAFGPGDAVVMSWPGCVLAEPSLDELVDRLREERAFFAPDGSWLFHRVTSGREAAEALVAPRGQGGEPGMTRDQAINRLRPSLVGPDRSTTAVVIVFTAEGLKQRSRLVAAIRELSLGITGIKPDDLHLAGPVIDGLSVDQASQTTLARYAAPSSLVVFLLCWAGLRSIRAAAIVFGLAAFSQAATLALVYYSGHSMTALMIVLPPMVQVLAVAAGLHLTNYYFNSERSGEEGALAAIRAGWAPCVLSAATTAIGMGSLLASGLTPIRQFGGFAAAGVVLATVILLGFLPPLLAWARVATRGPTEPGESDNKGTAAYVAAVIARWRYAIALLGVAAIGVGSYYAAQIGTSVRIETLFPPGSRILEDYAWIEEHVGPLVPLDVVLTIPTDSSLSEREKLALLWKIGREIAGGDQAGQLGRAVSAASLMAPPPGMTEIPPDTPAEVIEEYLLAHHPLLSGLGVLSSNADSERWRLTVRASALGDADYGALLASVAGDVTAVIDKVRASTGAPIGVTVTGIMPLVHAIQSQLLDDLIKSFVAALILITVTMTLVQAGVVRGLIAMGSNVFPIAVYFGWLGWRGQPIDIGVVMTASVALGVAVDDTLHFLTFFQRGIQRGASPVLAIAEALRKCAPAMTQTSVSCGLGLLVLALSDFAPTRGFAISMAVLLSLALVGDMLLLPALLLVSTRGKHQSDPAIAVQSDCRIDGDRELREVA